MTLQKVLLEGEPIAAGEDKRLLPSLDVSRWDRLHFHISGGTRGIAGMSVRILFGTPVDGKVLLTDSAPSEWRLCRVMAQYGSRTRYRNVSSRTLLQAPTVEQSLS